MLNLDTHILIHAPAGTLTRRERVLLSGESWSVSAIVLWELAKLAQLKRISLDFDSPAWNQVFAEVRIWPLDLAVSRAIAKLDFKSDPADEIIATTSIVHHVPLLTRDRKILRSKLVPFAS